MLLILLSKLAAIEAFISRIPEAAGLLLFGIALVAAAVLIRWLLGRSHADEQEKGLEKKVQTKA